MDWKYASNRMNSTWIVLLEYQCHLEIFTNQSISTIALTIRSICFPLNPAYNPAASTAHYLASGSEKIESNRSICQFDSNKVCSASKSVRLGQERDLEEHRYHIVDPPCAPGITRELCYSGCDFLLVPWLILKVLLPELVEAVSFSLKLLL